MSNRVLRNVWLVGWIAAIPVAMIALNSLISLPNFFIMVSAMSLWLFCLIIAGGASRFDSLAAEERQELREARLQLAKLEEDLSRFSQRVASDSLPPAQDELALKGEVEDLKKKISDRDDLLAEQIIAMQRVSALVPEVELRVKAVVEQFENHSAVTVTQVSDVYQKSREHLATTKEISTQFLGKNIYASGVRDLSSIAAILSGAFQVLSEVAETFRMHRQSSEELAVLFRSLNGDKAMMSKVAEDILAISDQANLLVLNTTISLARAGGEERIFRVVAEELRRISDRMNFTSLDARQILATFPDSLAKISELLEITVSANLTKMELLDAEVQRLIGPAKVSSSVLAKLVSESISTADSIALNIDQIAASLNFQDQFRIDIDHAISPIRQVGYYVDESILRVASLIKPNEFEAVPAVDLTSSSQFMSCDSPSDPHNLPDAV